MKLLNRISAAQLFLVIAFVYASGYIAHALYLGKTVYGDGIYYYAWLSLQVSKHSVGPAVFWAPVYILTHNQIAVGAVSALAALFALVLLFHMLTTYFSKTVSMMTVASIAGASNLLFYGSLDAVNSHALTFFAATVFLALLAERKHWFAIGLALGILGLMRPQDVVYAIVLLPLLTKRNIFRITLGFMLAFTPQLIAWYLATGKLLVSPYLVGAEGFDLLHPHILGVLFGIRSGLFLWTPITLIGAAGLIIGKKYRFLLVFIVQLFLISSWSTWWQGASYSGRMFVSSLPILAFGIASVFSLLSRFRFTQSYYLLAIVIPLSLINAISICYFLLTLH